MTKQSVRAMNSVLGRSTVCPTVEVSPTVKDIEQTLADVKPIYTFRRSGASRILYKYELCIHVANCTRIH